MATATAQRPPTEAEIREAIEAEIPVPNDPDLPLTRFDPPDGIWDALDPIMDCDMAITPSRRSPEGWSDEFSPRADHPGTLWADLRPSEAAELREAIEKVQHDAFRAYLVAVRDGAIEAAVRFAAAHPDIPRGRWPIAE